MAEGREQWHRGEGVVTREIVREMEEGRKQQ
jgi:hypothetical protein